MPTHQQEQKESVDDIVQLASQVGVTCSRGPDNVFTEWHANWARWHPQRHERVVVHHGREAWQRQQQQQRQQRRRRNVDPNLLSIVSWNVLSNTWYSKSRETGYAHTLPQDGVWTQRFPRIVAWIQSLLPDVLLLQEVDFDQFETDWLPALHKLGYNGRMQRHQKRQHRADQPCGVAMFYRTSRLAPARDKDNHEQVALHFSRSMAIRFESKVAEEKGVEEELDDSIKVQLRREWETLGVQQPVQPKGKPSPAVKAELQAHAQKVKEWKNQQPTPLARAFCHDLSKGRA